MATTKRAATATEKETLDQNGEAAERALEEYMRQVEANLAEVQENPPMNPPADDDGQVSAPDSEFRLVYEVHDVDAKPGSYSLEAFMELLNSDSANVAIVAVLPRDHGRNQVIVSRLV